MKSQEQLVLHHLKQGRQITSLSALQLYGIISLPRRICSLLEQGHKVRKSWKMVAKAHGGEARIRVYSL